MYHQESYYWWHKVKRNLVKSQVKKLIGTKKDNQLLDIGCGTGKLMEDLEIFGRVFGVDSSAISLDFCRKRGIKNVSKCRLSQQELPFKDNYFNVITCLDVIEHIENPIDALLEINRVLKPGGYLVVTVPAYQFMFSYWDRILHHKRRYTVGLLKKQLEKANFSTVKTSYFYSILLPLAIFVRILKSMLKNQSSDFMEMPPPINKLLFILFNLESKIVGLISLPLGLSIIGIFKKKSK